MSPLDKRLVALERVAPAAEPVTHIELVGLTAPGEEWTGPVYVMPVDEPLGAGYWKGGEL